ncbi:MAG: hypothetical protein WD333_05850 [Dehalococcoidia bacterium]
METYRLKANSLALSACLVVAAAALILAACSSAPQYEVGSFEAYRDAEAAMADVTSWHGRMTYQVNDGGVFSADIQWERGVTNTMTNVMHTTGRFRAVVTEYEDLNVETGWRELIAIDLAAWRFDETGALLQENRQTLSRYGPPFSPTYLGSMSTHPFAVSTTREPPFPLVTGEDTLDGHPVWVLAAETIEGDMFIDKQTQLLVRSVRPVGDGVLTMEWFDYNEPVDIEPPPGFDWPLGYPRPG